MTKPLVPAKKNVALGSSNTWWLDVKDDEFVHFTTASRADSIISSGKLLHNPPGIRQFGASGVHGISTTYGRYVPRTQTTHIDVAENDVLVAIVFTTRAIPKIGFVEEVIWNQDVPLTRARIIPAERGVALVKAAPVKMDENDIVVYTPDQNPGSTAPAPQERLASTSRVEDFVKAFFGRHPQLRRFAPRRVTEGARGGTSHPEARQHGNEIWLSDKFFALDTKTQDFVFAHELGHYAIAEYGLVNLIEVLSLAGVDPWDTGNLPFGQGNMDEAFADAFASLVTDKDVERRYPEWADAVRKVTKLATR